MEKLKLTIDGYKCFEKKYEFNLNNITILTGANSAGKSSVVQSLLLTKVISEVINENGESDDIPISLMNKKYSMELGNYDDIINRQTSTGDIEFSLSDITISVVGEKNEYVDNNNVIFSIPIEIRKKIKNFFSEGFTYLCAERIAPHYEYKETKFNEVCDCHGTNIGDVYGKYQNSDIFETRSLNFTTDTKIGIQLDEWCDYIFPGVFVRLEKTGSQMYKLKIRNDVAPNVGFGITYALPILISGLIIPQGGILIIENPEAHLHPKAQSNMGYFLARIAASGIRVVIETHSEHIINGIRRMIIEGKTEMSHNDMTIYFFQKNDDEKNIMEIKMDKFGNLSDFPLDFFDQVRQDMFKLIEFGRQIVKNEG